MAERNRLTAKDSFGDLCFEIDSIVIHSADNVTEEVFDKILHRLFEFEQAEEYGQIIKTSGEIDVSGTVSYPAKAIREWAEAEIKRGDDPYINKFYNRYFGAEAERVPNDRVYYFVTYLGPYRSIDVHGTSQFAGYSIRRDLDKSPRMTQPDQFKAGNKNKKWRK